MAERLRIALSGAHGFIGTRVAQMLEERGYEVWPLVREKKKNKERAKEIFYDYEHGEIDDKALEQCSAVVHLAGKNIMSGLWTTKFKQELWDSRVESTKLIAQTMARVYARGPRILICASAVGFYGDRGDEVLDEQCSRGEGFLAKLCEAWERATYDARDAGVRVVNTRFATVLGRDGGMLKPLEKIFELGLGAIMGSGKQYMALVGREDLVRALLFALDDPTMHGAVNIVSPQDTTNAYFSDNLARALGKKIRLRMPAWVLRSMGEQGKIFLESCRAQPRALLEAGFKFEEPTLREILKNIYYISIYVFYLSI